jgi:DNA-binding response OmpR family regulator
MTDQPYTNVMVVEDEDTLRHLIARNLRSRGVCVREASCAEEGFAEILAEPPDLLLLDVNLPDRSGWELLRELRLRSVRVPTIVVSAVRLTPNRMAEFQPLAYLPKPFPLEALLRLVLGTNSRTPVENEEDEAETSSEPSRKDVEDCG